MTTAKKAAPKQAAKKAAGAPNPDETPDPLTAGPDAVIEPATLAAPDNEPASGVTPDVETSREKVEAANTAELGTPAYRRANDLAALEQELDMCERSGKTERVTAIKAAIRDLKSSVRGRSTGNDKVEG